MNSKEYQSEDAIGLRKKAEEIIRAKESELPENIDGMSPEETRRTLHELRVHQIELEMQNEELRRSQTELDAQRARYFDLYDLAPVGYATIGEKGLILEANLTIATMLGAVRGALVNQLLPRFIHKDDQEIYYLHRNQLFKSGVPLAFDLRMVKNDGTVFWASLRSTSSQYPDGATVWRVVVSDITEHKQAEETIHESESLIRGITNSAQDAIVMMTPDGLISFWNPAAEHLLGYTKDEAIGQDLHLLFTPERYHEAYRASFLKFFLTGQGNAMGKTLDLTARRKDGLEIVISLSLSALYVRGRWHAIGILRDITELRRLEQIKEDVERILHHDLKTPLTGLIGIPQVLLMDETLTTDQRELITLVELSGNKMLRQINNFLEIYKIESGTYRLQAKGCNPAKLVRDNIDIATRGMRFSLDQVVLRDHAARTDEGDLTLMTDPLLLDIILMNILKNALEASDKEAQVFVDLSLENGDYCIAISNDRPVLDEIRDRFFEKYATAGKSGGTGLGTYSAYIMTKAIGGTIGMETSEETGTKVTVRLPMTA